MAFGSEVKLFPFQIMSNSCHFSFPPTPFLLVMFVDIHCTLQGGPAPRESALSMR